MDPDAIADEGIAIDNGEQNPNLPLLIVGPSGSGKTYELNIHTIAEIRKRLKAQNDPAIAQTRALCMTPFNTATSTLTAKVMKGLEVLIAEDFPLLSADRPPIVDPNCTTVHHTCRKWLATYGHLIGEPNMAEVCSEERAKRLLELLQSPENFDFYEQNQNDRMREVERVRNELEEELTLAVPNLEELEGAMLAAKACKDARLFALTLQEFIRVYKINDFRLVDELFERFGDRRVDAGIELFEWYERILRHNRLYDFEDLVIFGLRLAERHARHIIKSEKVGMIVIDDFQNSYGQQRRFLKALMSVEGSPIRLIVACHDHHIAQTMGGQLELLDRTAYAFTGAHISLTPDELMAQILPAGALYQHLDYRVNRRSSSNIQQVAYGIFNRHLLNVDREGVQYQPVAVGSPTIFAEARFIKDEILDVYIQDYFAGRRFSTVAIMTRTNANVRFLVDALTRLYFPIRVLGLENIDICSNEALDILSFLGSIKDPSMHHLVERSLVIFSKCRNNVEPRFEGLPGPDVMKNFIQGNYIDRGEDAPGHIHISEHHRRYLDLLRRFRAAINAREGRLREAVDSLLEELQYKERILRTRLAPDGSPSPPPDFDINQNAPHPSSDYAGARWQNVRSFLIRLLDFDDRCAGHNDPLDLFLRECHAYAPEQLAYIRRRNPGIEITLSTMHYGIGSEYDVVIISNAENGSLPSPACRDAAEVQQDKTLFHLSMLCARQRLYFTFLQQDGLTSFLDGVRQLLRFHNNGQV